MTQEHILNGFNVNYVGMFLSTYSDIQRYSNLYRKACQNFYEWNLILKQYLQATWQ